MGIVIQQSVRSSIIAYIGIPIGFINLLWLCPYFLTSEQIALFKLVQSSAYLLAAFGQIGLAQSLVRFFPQHKADKGFVTAMLLGGILGFLLLCMLTLIFREQIVAYFSKKSTLFIDYFQVTLIISFLLINFYILEAYARSLLKIEVPTLLRDIGLRGLTTLALLSYGIEIIRYETLIYLLVLIYALVLIGLVVILKRRGDLAWSLDFSFLKRGRWKRILNFGLYSVLGAGGTQIILQIDSIMVNGTLGLKTGGIYIIAFFIGQVIEMPKRMITQVSTTLLVQSFNKGDMKTVSRLYRQTSINQMIIGALLFIGIWANLRNIYHFVPHGEEYIQGFYVVLFIGLGKLSDMLFGTNGEIIVMSKYFRFNVLAVSILAGLTIILNIILIPRYGIEGAAVASFFAMLCFNVVKYLFVWIKFRIQPFTISTLKFIMIALTALLANHYLPVFQNIYVDLLFRSLVIVTLLIVPAYRLKISPEMNSLIRNSLSGRFRF